MKFEDLKFMSAGSYCLSLYALGPGRIKGPVDNILMLNHTVLKLLLEHKYYEYLTTAKYSKKSDKKYFFKDLQIRHNNFEDQKYLVELKKRLNTFYKFIDDIKKDSNKFLVFSISHAFFRTDLKKEVYACISLLKENNLLNKTIFISASASPNIKIPENDWAWFNFRLDDDFVNELQTKYNIKYLELTDINLFTEAGQQEISTQFYRKVEKLLH